MSNFLLNFLDCLYSSFNNIKRDLISCIKDKRRKKDFFSENLFNNEEEQPAKILSSEEIGNMINNQIKYNEEKVNLSEYKIVKDNKEDEINVNELKHEIQQVEFDDDDEIEKGKKNNKNNNNNNNNKNDDDDNIEDLKKQFLNNQDI